MKKTIIILIILGFSGIISGQSNLEFSKVIKLSGNHEDYNSGTTITSVIVPTNTIWKITSGSGTSQFILYIDNHVFYGPNGSYNSIPAYFPIWLPAGTYVISKSNTSGGSGIWSISGIEFKIVP